MIVIGIDLCVLELRRRDHGNEVTPLLHFYAQLAQLGRHGMQAIGLFHPPVIDIANGGWPLGKQRRNRDGHGRIGNMVHIHIDAVQRRLLRFDKVITPGDARAHLLQYVGEMDVALNAVLADAGDPHLALDGACREEVGSAGSIPFNQKITGADISLIALDVEQLVVVVLDDHPKLLHDVQGDIDIGLGDQLPLDVNASVASRHGSSHQEGGQELAGNGTIDMDIAAPQPLGIHNQRRKTIFFQVLDMSARLTQGINQMADRALFHARLATQGVLTGAQTQRGTERAHGSAGIAKEQIDRLFDGKTAAKALHSALGLVGRELVLDPELGQCRQHVTNVIAVEQVGQTGSTTGQCRQQQRPVRDTL